MKATHSLCVIIACYNEERTIIAIVEKVLAVELSAGIPKTILVIDDASTDQTWPLLQSFIATNPEAPVRLYRHEKNSGKGACIRKGIEVCDASIVIIQDADLEYDPQDYNRLLSPILDGYADVVYGSRFRGSEPHRVLFFFHTIGNKFLTFLSNVFTQLNLTDMETGYKMFRFEVLQRIRLKENRFGFEPEVTAKISRIRHIRIYEVGISYFGRTFSEGKKINWTDGFRSIYCILKYNLFSRR